MLRIAPFSAKVPPGLRPRPQARLGGDQALKATTFWVCSPRPSMPKRITSPRFK
jgi:hypothetical protein